MDTDKETSCKLCSFIDELQDNDRATLTGMMVRGDSADSIVNALSHWKKKRVVGTTTVKTHIRENHGEFV